MYCIDNLQTMIVERGKNVKITALPLSEDKASIKLAEFFHSQLEKKTHMENR